MQNQLEQMAEAMRALMQSLEGYVSVHGDAYPNAGPFERMNHRYGQNALRDAEKVLADCGQALPTYSH